MSQENTIPISQHGSLRRIGVEEEDAEAPAVQELFGMTVRAGVAGIICVTHTNAHTYAKTKSGNKIYPDQ